jgi:hypothetical protein
MLVFIGVVPVQRCRLWHSIGAPRPQTMHVANIQWELGRMVAVVRLSSAAAVLRSPRSAAIVI